MLAVIKTELWQRRWSLVWWSVGVAALVGIDMLLYASIKDEAAQFDQVTQNLPATVRALFSDSGSFLTPVGFLSARVYYLLLPLVLSIFTIGLGSSLIAKEERHGTLELLLARPISRTKLLVAKLLAGALAVFILGVVALVTAWICLGPSGLTGVSHIAILITTVQAAVLSSLFGAVAFAITAMGRSARGASGGIAALFAFAGYIIASLESTVSWLHHPAQLFPYHYYRPSEILAGTSNQKWSLLGFMIAIFILVIVSWASFRRRDIG